VRPKVPKDYNRAYLQCRTFGHSWHVGEGYGEGVAFYRFVLVCEVCKTRRIDTVNRRTGTVVQGSRRYEYPPGYQANRDEGLARTVYRIEFIRRFDDG
jgi:hypothetical protein